MISQDNKKGLRNPWVLGILLLIAVVLAVNATFVWFATHNRSSLVDRGYNTRDRKTSEDVVRELGAQHALAWKATVKLPAAVLVNTPAAYEISVVDRDGKAVSGRMEVEAYRAADASKDFTTPFSEASYGTYRGQISFPLKGYWELRIRIKRGDDAFEAVTGRFMVALPSSTG